MKYLYTVSLVALYSCGHCAEKAANEAAYREANVEGVRVMKEFNKRAEDGTVTIETVDSLALILELNSRKIDSLDKLR